ncbi:exopolysaccharide biosynthesis protein [Kaistia sp. 32K]|nr:exopolysaccharide biosynthesis protein [Kaistia sp. 32K]
MSEAGILPEDKYIGAAVKSGFDFVGALCALVILLPFFIAIAGAMLILQGRPILIRHRRIGRHGRPFGCFKLRTMVVDGDEVLERHLAANPEARREWAGTHKLKADPRVTPLGRVMRSASVDELPQFLNVVMGQMSLVGPRPIVEAEVVKYGQVINQYCKVRPGITGLWQVNGRNDVSYSRRVELDDDYVTNRSFWGDIGILLRTIPAVLKSKGSY